MSLILESQQKRLTQLNKELEQPHVWEDLKKTHQLNREKSHIEKNLKDYQLLSESLEESTLFLELLEDEKDEQALNN